MPYICIIKVERKTIESMKKFKLGDVISDKAILELDIINI